MQPLHPHSPRGAFVPCIRLILLAGKSFPAEDACPAGSGPQQALGPSEVFLNLKKALLSVPAPRQVHFEVYLPYFFGTVKRPTVQFGIVLHGFSHLFLAENPIAMTWLRPDRQKVFLKKENHHQLVR